jgi:drug/metabolite transporter (DMT)-like permease
MWKNDLKDSALLLMAGLVLVNIFWAASSIAAKEALLQLSAIEIITLRFGIALLIVVGLALVLKGPGSLKIDPKDLPMFVFLSIVSVSLGFFLQVEAISRTTVTNFSIEFNMSTFLIMLMGAAFLGERLTRKRMLGAAIAFGGAVLIISGGRLDLSSHLAGDLIGLASAVSFGLFTIASKRISRKYGIMTILSYTFLFGIIELLPFYVFYTPMTPLSSLSAVSWSSILFLAVLCSVFCFLVYTHGLKKLKASDVAMSIYVNPLAGVLLAILLMGEALTAYTVAGGALVMAGMYLTQGEMMPERPAREESASHGRTTAINE